MRVRLKLNVGSPPILPFLSQLPTPLLCTTQFHIYAVVSEAMWTIRNPLSLFNLSATEWSVSDDSIDMIDV